MSINIEVTHVTPAGANIFAELGFGEDEAKELQAQAQAQIAAAHALKVQLMHELTQWMTTHQFKQAEAARILGVSRPRVSDMVNLKTGKFTLDTLIEMVHLTGRRVQLDIC